MKKNKRINRTNKIINYILLYTAFLIYSVSFVCIKTASIYKLFSFKSLFFYFLSFLTLGAFAIIWQKVLKRFPLNYAFIHRPIVMVFGMIWGFIIFQERIKWNMILGCIIIFLGVWQVSKHYE